MSGGFYLKLEILNNNGQNNNAISSVNNIPKKVSQKAFQFSYDPIFKRFTRELRD